MEEPIIRITGLTKHFGGGEPVAAGNPVDAIAGATYSSDAVFNALNAAITCYNTELKGVA